MNHPLWLTCFQAARSSSPISEDKLLYFRYPTEALPFQRPSQDEKSKMNNEAPLTPFCCVSAISMSFRYLVDLLPASTLHNPLLKPFTSAPLVSVFLAHVANCYANPHAPRAKEPNQPSASNLYYAIIQLTVTENPTPSTVMPALPRQAKPPTSSSSFENIPLSPSSAVLAKDLGYETISPSSSIAVQQIGVKYFVPIETSREATILSAGQRLKGKQWKELAADDAMDSLRLPGTNITIGDGEAWKELEGRERGSCTKHKLDWEIRVWIKE